MTFETCNTHFYDVYSSLDNEMSYTMTWTNRATLLGSATGVSTWTDTDDLSAVTGRFYRVARLASRDDLDADGLSNSQEALAGSDPRDADTDDDGILDGPFNTNNVGGVSYSLSGIPDAFPNDASRSVDTDGDGVDDLTDADDDNDGLPDAGDPDPVVPITVAPFKAVIVQTNVNVAGGDTGTEVFDVGARGRPLPCAAGMSSNSYTRLYGGIYFNHDATNLYVGVAGLDQGGDNFMLLVLDTDGGSGGVTNLAGMVTSGLPRGITQSHNLSFTAATFTPNIGIIVGNRFKDGKNDPSFAFLGGNAAGIGVYQLLSTNAPSFGSFGSPGAPISQWGDLATLIPGRTNAANAGIEIALSKTQLGLATKFARRRSSAVVPMA